MSQVLVGFRNEELHGNVAIDLETYNITLDNISLSLIQWRNVRDRIDKVLSRKHPEANKATPNPRGSLFIIQNLKSLNAISRGHIKKAPWWCRWLFDFVITKDKLERN